MGKNGSITYQIKQELLSKCRFNESRHDAKKAGEAYKYIYSYGTLNTYMKQLYYMVTWAKANNIKLKSLDDIRLRGDQWLSFCASEGMSPYTLSTRRAALCKLCNVPYSYFKTPVHRTRADIKRSRDKSKSLKFFSEQNNIEQVIFCKCSGLRLSELKAITGDALYFRNGKAFLNVTKGTKGGRPRFVELCGSQEEINVCIELCNKVGNNKVFSKVNTHANTHGYRADYAHRIYEKYARDLSYLSKREKLYCRKDKKGIVYDREALFIVSKNLGHNRIEVCNLNYLY